MTKQEALEHFGLSASDRLSRQGLLDIIQSNKQLLKQTASESTRQECRKTIEACKALLD